MNILQLKLNAEQENMRASRDEMDYYKAKARRDVLVELTQLYTPNVAEAYEVYRRAVKAINDHTLRRSHSINDLPGWTVRRDTLNLVGEMAFERYSEAIRAVAEAETLKLLEQVRESLPS